jgi:hypothetical protein
MYELGANLNRCCRVIREQMMCFVLGPPHRPLFLCVFKSSSHILSKKLDPRLTIRIDIGVFPKTILHRLELLYTVHTLGLLFREHETGEGFPKLGPAGTVCHPAETGTVPVDLAGSGVEGPASGTGFRILCVGFFRGQRLGLRRGCLSWGFRLRVWSKGRRWWWWWWSATGIRDGLSWRLGTCGTPGQKNTSPF